MSARRVGGSRRWPARLNHQVAPRADAWPGVDRGHYKGRSVGGLHLPSLGTFSLRSLDQGTRGVFTPNSERARSLILAGQGPWSLFSDEPRCSTRPMTEEEESRLIRQLIERLVMRFPQLPAKTVEKEVRSVHHGFQGAPLRDFVPLLVEHDVVISLKVLAGRAHRSPEQQATPA